MIMYVTDVGVVDEVSFVSIDNQELNHLDKIMAFSTYKLLRSYLGSDCSAWPTDFSDKEEWKASIEEHAISLKAYTRLDNYEDEQEHKVVKDAKEALRFVADYLEELYE